jgi:hypothetical protein
MSAPYRIAALQQRGRSTTKRRPRKQQKFAEIQLSFPARSDRTHDQRRPRIKENIDPHAREWNQGPSAIECN